MQNGADTADELVQPVSVCPLHVSTEDYVSSTVLQKLKGLSCYRGLAAKTQAHLCVSV